MIYVSPRDPLNAAKGIIVGLLVGVLLWLLILGIGYVVVP